MKVGDRVKVVAITSELGRDIDWSEEDLIEPHVGDIGTVVELQGEPDANGVLDDEVVAVLIDSHVNFISFTYRNIVGGPEVQPL